MKRSAAVVTLALLAAVNLAAGVMFAARGGDRTLDLWVFRGWLEEWIRGADVVSASPWEVENPVDYPPWALITFLPLGLVPPSLVVSLSAAVSAVAAAALAFVSARVMAPKAARLDLAVPALLVLCWGACVRTNVFLTTVPFLLGLLAVWRHAHPWQSGIFLGLALAKPHVALPFVAWACVRGRFKPLAIGAGVVLLELAVYCAWASANPLDVTAHWLRNVHAMYTGPTDFVGLTGIRGFFEESLSPSTMDRVSMVFAAAVIFVMWRLRADVLPSGAPLVVPIGALLVLFAFYHYWEDLLLFAPVFMAAYFTRGPYPPYGRVFMLIAMQIVLMTDIRQRPWMVPIDAWPVPLLVENSYRLLVLAALAYMVRLKATAFRIPNPESNVDHR